LSGNPVLRTLAIAASAALLATALAVPASAASPTACRVTNLDTGVTRNKLQKAVWQARPGQRLTVRGTCRGLTTIKKRLYITGVRKGASGRPTLDGDTKGTVMTVWPRRKVVISDLQIRGGYATQGAGIYNEGTLILKGSTAVRLNIASQGAGGVWNSGILKLKGSALIKYNVAKYSGGVHNTGTLSLNGFSSIRGNDAPLAGGVYNREGTMTLKGSSSITGNIAEYGGGVYNAVGTLRLAGSSLIARNLAYEQGGGVFNDKGTLVLADSSSITGNTAHDKGGGLFSSSGTLDNVNCGSGGNVHDNSPNDCSLP
jgi:hypothetical protein